MYIQVLDVNDHAPEFAKYYETFVCENVVSGQVSVKELPTTFLSTKEVWSEVLLIPLILDISVL